MTHKLLKKILVKGQITTLTGLAIGGSNTAMGIGGVDKGVIRNPITLQPYIPGSTLKGKMRSLLELKYGWIGNTSMGQVKNGPSENQDHNSTKLFGNAAKGEAKQRPSRLIVRDACLSELQGNPKKTMRNNLFKIYSLLCNWFKMITSVAAGRVVRVK